MALALEAVDYAIDRIVAGELRLGRALLHDAMQHISVALNNQARAVKRRSRGVRPRHVYFESLKVKPKPWEAAGVPRWRWYKDRRQANA